MSNSIEEKGANLPSLPLKTLLITDTKQHGEPLRQVAI